MKKILIGSLAIVFSAIGLVKIANALDMMTKDHAEVADANGGSNTVTLKVKSPVNNNHI